MLTEEQIESKRKLSEKWWDDNQTQYYGLSIEEVQVVIGEYDDALDMIASLQQQNKQLIEALEAIADYTNPTGEDGREMALIARLALGTEETP